LHRLTARAVAAFRNGGAAIRLEGFVMTALVLAPRPALPQSQQWNWPRVGALSGALSLHFIAIVKLLVPPAALIVLHPPKEDPIWVDWIKPPPKFEEPELPEPKPIVHELPYKAAPHRVATPPTPPVESQMPARAADPSPPAEHSEAAVPADIAPVALAYHTRTKIPYPRDAFLLRQQGTVILRVLVGTDGVPQTVEIEQSSGSRSLDNAARDAVKKWTFQAGTRNGIPAPLWARVPITFMLQSL